MCKFGQDGGRNNYIQLHGHNELALAQLLMSLLPEVGQGNKYF